MMYVLSHPTPAPAQHHRRHTLSSVNSIRVSLIFWVLGFVLPFCDLLFLVKVRYCMLPRSDGEKVYLEAVYKKPKFLVTVIFAMNPVLLESAAAGYPMSSCPIYKEIT